MLMVLILTSRVFISQDEEFLEQEAVFLDKLHRSHDTMTRRPLTDSAAYWRHLSSFPGLLVPTVLLSICLEFRFLRKSTGPVRIRTCSVKWFQESTADQQTSSRLFLYFRISFVFIDPLYKEYYMVVPATWIVSSAWLVWANQTALNYHMVARLVGAQGIVGKKVGKPQSPARLRPLLSFAWTRNETALCIKFSFSRKKTFILLV